MDDLQYRINVNIILCKLRKYVLNLVINGWPSILETVNEGAEKVMKKF